MGLRIGTQLGPNEILSAIGAGGMGEVYRAYDSRLNRDVALKIHMEGVAADGSPIDFTYSYKYSDGKDSSATGNVVVKRVNAHTFLGTTKRDGKVVGKTRAVISDDGRVMTFLYSGIDEDGKHTGHRTVYDKQ
jgi:serine/threonine protein kinase